MRRIVGTLALAFLASALPTGVLAAGAPHPSGKSMHVALHVTSKFKKRAIFMHVMATAKIRTTKTDAFITVTTDGLPKPSVLGERAYAVFATDGSMADRVGFLHMNGSMGAVKGEVMMAKVTDIYVYAVPSMSVKHPMGKK